MSSSILAKEIGRTAFGLDPAGYDRSRPDYPDWVFETIRSRCHMEAGTAVFEIGAGTGKATRRILDLKPSSLVAIEPDPRLASFLRGRSGEQTALQVINSTFEEVELEPSTFDLGTSATAFHWLDESTALAKIAGALRPGGWWAPFWNIYGDPTKPDPFHEATHDLLSSGPASPSSIGSSRLEFGADVDARIGAMRAAGAFNSIDWHRSTWSVVLDAAQIVELYASYSNISLRSDRQAVLAELGRIAHEDFHDRVTRNITTILYLAQRAA